MSTPRAKRRTPPHPSEPHLATFERLLSEAREFFPPFQIHQHVEEVYGRLLTFHASELGGFDCFEIGGWRPTENQLSDIIAAILDPRRGHGFGFEILQALFNRLLTYPFSPVQQLRVRNVANAIQAAGGDITVKRERIGMSSRADIEVWGRNFLIIIEHKVARGKETFGNVTHQTFRLEHDFTEKAAKFGIQATHLILIFLTPEGMRPQNPEFIPVSFEFLSKAIAEVVEREGTLAARSILGFSAFYRRLS
jgi:hypothetical protein